MGLFDSDINMKAIDRILNEVDEKPKDNIVQFMKKHNIKRLKLGVKEFEIELQDNAKKRRRRIK